MRGPYDAMARVLVKALGKVGTVVDEADPFLHPSYEGVVYEVRLDKPMMVGDEMVDTVMAAETAIEPAIPVNQTFKVGDIIRWCPPLGNPQIGLVFQDLGDGWYAAQTPSGCLATLNAKTKPRLVRRETDGKEPLPKWA